ncbi:uncharacterized protein Cipc [Periplaneta americana]|uniref:uncharacterized protein Cipc n=1 Tax=Periplaneta americana TaxID=6978 RepID=UPI0037E71E52
MAPTVYVAELSSNPGRSHLYPDTLDDILEGGLRVRRRPHRPPRSNKEYRPRGSVWLQSPLMGLTAEDSRQQAMSREEEEANISTNSISSSIDSNSSSNEDSNNTVYRSGSSGDESLDSDREAKSWSRDEILQHQQQQCQRLLLLRRREGLLDITMRTVNLMRRNQQLQHRLAALQAETRAFVRSVLNNPENQAIRELTQRTRRRSNSEDEDEYGTSIKRLKEENSIITISTTSTTATSNSPTSPTTTTTGLTSATTMEQDPVVSESDNSEK